MNRHHRLPVHEVLVLDFDGVVLESTAIKDQAFHDLFQKAGQTAQGKVLEYHRARPGINRRVKIRRILDDVLGWPSDDQSVTYWCERYSALVADGLRECREVPGVRAYLQVQRKPAYIVSAAPQNEVREIAAKRNLSAYFKAIYGSPRNKRELLRLVSDLENVEAGDLLFIGDKLTDYEAARDTGAAFIGRRGPGDCASFPPDLPCIASFLDLV